MSDETKYRVDAEEEPEEKKGFFRPLPEKKKVEGVKQQPVVKFLGVKMYERNRDLLVMFLVPFLAAVINANIYALVIVDILEEVALYMFVVPMVSAIPIGLTVHQTKNALFASLISSMFFIVIFILFLISPALIAPELDIGEFFISGMVISAVYFLFVIFANLLGSLVGALMREFF